MKRMSGMQILTTKKLITLFRCVGVSACDIIVHSVYTCTVLEGYSPWEPPQLNKDGDLIAVSSCPVLSR